MIGDFAAAYGTSYMALRYFNAAGADPDGEIGEDHDPEPHLVPRLIRAVQGREPEVHIFGTDYPTPDGTCVRDYVHVTDLAQAHVQALKRLDGDNPPTVVNLGAGRGVSVRQVINAVSCIAGSPVPVRDAPRRDGDPAYLVAEIGLAKSALAWSPSLSSLARIVRTAWSWHGNADAEKP
jgi:UDP-arabinose 4-epimerase